MVPVLLTLQSRTGERIGKVTETLPPKGMLRKSITEIFGTTSEGGYVKATTEPDYLEEDPGCCGFFGYGIVGFERVQLPDRAIGLNGNPGNFLESEIFSAQLAENEAYETVLGLVNVNTHDYDNIYNDRLTLDLYAINENGSQLATPVRKNIGVGERIESQLTSLFSDLPAPTVGSIKITSQKKGNEGTNGRRPGAIGDVTFGDRNERFAAALPLQTEKFTRAILNQVANGGGFFTGAAFYNPGEATAEVILTVRDTEGKTTGEGYLELKAGERLARLIPQFVPETEGQVGGSIEVRSTRPIIGQQLFGGSNLETLSAVPATIIEEYAPLYTDGPQIITMHQGTMEAPFRRVYQIKHNPTLDDKGEPIGPEIAWASAPFPADRMNSTIRGQVCIGDLFNDDKREVVSANPDGTVRIFKAGSSGSPMHVQRIPGFANEYRDGVTDAAIADVDKDARNELVLGSGNVIVVSEWDGTRLVEDGEISRGSGPNEAISAFTTGDADDDGFDEIVAACFTTGLSIYKKEGSEYVRKAALQPGPGVPGPYIGAQHIESRIIDLDPAEQNGNEIVTGGNYAHFIIYKHTGGDEYERLYVSNLIEGNTHAVDVGDIDGDGNPEIIIGSAEFPHVLYYSRQGDDWVETARGPKAMGSHINSKALRSTDLDGDGRVETILKGGRSAGGNEGIRYSEGMKILKFKDEEMVVTYHTKRGGKNLAVTN